MPTDEEIEKFRPTDNDGFLRRLRSLNALIVGLSIPSVSEESSSLKQTDSSVAMAMRCILLTMLAQVTLGEKVALNTEKMPCPSTSFNFSTATDAAGDLVWDGPMSPTPDQHWHLVQLG